MMRIDAFVLRFVREALFQSSDILKRFLVEESVLGEKQITDSNLQEERGPPFMRFPRMVMFICGLSPSHFFPSLPTSIHPRTLAKSVKSRPYKIRYKALRGLNSIR